MIEMLNCDCMEYMAGLPDKAFDLAIVDPPYNVNFSYNTHNDNMDEDKYHAWSDKWFSELSRVCDTIVITVGYKNMKYWVNKNPRHMIIWAKPNQSSPSPLGGFNAYEIVFYFGKLQKRIGHDIFEMNIGQQADASFHPCPKYLPAWKKILSLCIDPPAKILDIFGGSGTTAIACHDLGYDLTWMELDADYYAAACKRYKDHAAQGSLFEPQEIRQKTYNNEFDLTS